MKKLPYPGWEVKYTNDVAEPVKAEKGLLTQSGAQAEANYWNFDVPLDYEEGRCW